MARGLAPLVVITQASAHAAPTLGNEFKVVNWLRTAAIIARVDPVKAGYLVTDAAGHLRLPALGTLGDVDLNALGQTNVLAEYTIHNLSDADFTFSIPAVGEASVLLAQLAPEFGYDPASGATLQHALPQPRRSSYLSGERLLDGCAAPRAGGGARAELQALRQHPRRHLTPAARRGGARRPVAPVPSSPRYCLLTRADDRAQGRRHREARRRRLVRCPMRTWIRIRDARVYDPIPEPRAMAPRPVSGA